MIINLKQAEIVAALKLYINQQGINLAGKTVTIDFTAGRKESGLSAEINIEDGAVPGYTDSFAIRAVPTSKQESAEAPQEVVLPAETGTTETPEAIPSSKPVSIFT